MWYVVCCDRWFCSRSRGRSCSFSVPCSGVCPWKLHRSSPSPTKLLTLAERRRTRALPRLLPVPADCRPEVESRAATITCTRTCAFSRKWRHASKRCRLILPSSPATRLSSSSNQVEDLHLGHLGHNSRVIFTHAWCKCPNMLVFHMQQVVPCKCF